ncbi:hypothetical protein CTAYLR_010428 [Chrysophaeum taylorii]|uniref:CN hydrolase domain-containing protein n=1 Tax=Chrysophaeum taylorii TaxID=2483200 RepID=A0AAD7U9W0_9STRA|nr:hypothetical protein CTAYLR_010428 [Chrysophaeum taylorii]
MRGAVLRGLAAATAPLAMSSSMQAETPVRVAVVQMRVENDKTANLRHCRELVEKAADTGAQLVVLPEVWNSEYAVGAFAGNAEPVKLGKPEGASTELLGDLARRRGVWIVGGSIPERDGANIYNTAPVVDDLGTIVAKHRKVHLFDIDVPGKIRFFESETLAAGDEATVVPLPEDVAPGGHKLGVGICYDCRFAPLAITMRGKGATIIAYPGAFNTVTGPPHYHLLARARALDSQAFVLFASPARNPNSNYQAYGHSIICDPWGTPIATAKGHDEEIIVADLDLSRIAEVRASMRLWDQRRPDVYELGVKPPSEE